MGVNRQFINIEIKARCADPDHIVKYLLSKNAIHVGKSRQTDTYFNVKNGRLKIREDPMGNLVLYYERGEHTLAKQSNVIMLEYDPKTRLKEILEKSVGVLVVVKKTRDVYRIDNVKFNIDHVGGLGDFVEIEADDLEGRIGKKKLNTQLREYMAALGIKEDEVINDSYSDMLFGKAPKTI